ncbi:hypothetical protein [Siphonobacter sp. SORGH_AS_1065]|uniref:hypothetical protein n=1 Tax=Siphonobacter sp. SORGH_AS_1065 TaxID=3041795 RepID=UPI00278757EF|nr:hypothetical protein [Siphonobacter sp. SORGH_AS_1065]MDQ1088821.1 hypothetical protein [Siphonobacter sp. SORGH_AS_1065]
MRQLARLILIFILVAIFLIGLSKSFYHTLGLAGYLPDDYKYGDLYRFTNLVQFKQAHVTCPKLYPTGAPKASIALYAIGDSFMEPGSVDSSDFIAQRYSYTHWNDQKTIRLDTSLHNVLLIESVERHFREHLATLITNLSIVQSSIPNTPASMPTNDLVAFLEGTHDSRLKVPEERYDNVLFNWPVFLRLKEFKAWLNLHLFDRTHAMTSLSPDRKHVFLNLDTDSTLINSNFNSVSEEEITKLITHLNESFDKYRSLGFDEIYLSIIPNKTTVTTPEMGPYNHLIERIQSDTRLKVKIIDAYSLVKPLGAEGYQKGDSHWTCQSRDLWLRAINEQLTKSRIPSIP